MTREELIAAMRADGADTPVKVRVPRWGDLWVKSPTVEEAEAQPRLEGDAAERNKLARAAALVICDENGKRMFDPENGEDLALLSQRRSADLMAVLAAANGDAEGNLDSARSS